MNDEGIVRSKTSEDAVDVLCLGILVADVMAKPIERMPARGQLQLIDQVELHTGGCANNTAISLARLGYRVSIIGKVGQDGFGDFVLQKLAQEGVEIRGMRRDAEANTAFTFVMIAPDGERSFFHYLGANATLSKADVDLAQVARAKILHVAGTNLMPQLDEAPTAAILAFAREQGIITTLDTAWNSRGDWWQRIAPCLPYLDYCMPSLEEARMITGRETPHDIAAHLRDAGVRTVVIKMGAAGCFVQSSTGEFALPAYKVQVVDTSGAGDAFVGGFLAGLIEGGDLEYCARLANATGACCVTAIGCTTGIKNLAETQRFMETQRFP